VNKIKKWVSKEIIAKPNDLLHHPREADGVMLRRVAAYVAHHLFHRSRRAGWGVISRCSLKSTPFGVKPAGPRTKSAWTPIILIDKNLKITAFTPDWTDCSPCDSLGIVIVLPPELMNLIGSFKRSGISTRMYPPAHAQLFVSPFIPQAIFCGTTMRAFEFDTGRGDDSFDSGGDCLVAAPTAFFRIAASHGKEIEY